MKLQELNIEIGELRENVTLLIESISELRKNELQLKQQIGELKSENQNYRERIVFLEEKDKMVTMATSMDEGEKGEMKLKIRDLVRDIDECIAMIKG